VLNQVPRHEDVQGSEGIAPHNLNLGIIRKSVVSFTPRPLYPGEKRPQRLLDRRLSGAQSRSGREEKSSCPCWESNPGQPAYRLVTILIELPGSPPNCLCETLRHVLATTTAYTAGITYCMLMNQARTSDRKRCFSHSTKEAGGTWYPR
jgi:hypothetical protein